MKKITNLILIFAISLPVLALIVTACSEESDCSIGGRAMLHGRTYVRNELGDWSTGQLDSLTITALGTDSILLNRDTDVEIISLPLQYNNDTTAIVLHFSLTLRDTIVFKHSNTPYFISMDCGYEMRQAITTQSYHTTHALDSIYISNTETNNNGRENLRLYYNY